MPEAGGANLEVAKYLSEYPESRQSLRHLTLEIVEAWFSPQ